jgi:biotin carboxylase
MKTIVFIGCNKSGSSREAIKAAEKLGFFTVLITDRKIFLEKRFDFPDIHQMILTKLSDYNGLKALIKEIQKQGKEVGAIVSFIDPLVHVAAKLSKELGFTKVSSDPVVKMENKLLTRELLKGLSVSPYYARYRKDDSLKNFINKQTGSFPLIVKTPISTGSRDVLFVEDKRKLEKSINKLIKRGNKEVFVEEYLDGPQYLVEACVYDGKVHIIAVLEQEITFFDRFIVTGYCLLGDMDEVFYRKIYKTVCLILERFKLKNGSCHLEMRMINKEWKLIEINPRISGGAMNQIIETAFGINLVEETLKIFLGQKPNFKKKHKRFVYAHYLTSNSTGTLINISGITRCSQIPGIEEVNIKVKKGDILYRPLSMGDRYGYILASADNKKEAIRIAKYAATKIHIHIEPIQRLGE